MVLLSFGAKECADVVGGVQGGLLLCCSQLPVEILLPMLVTRSAALGLVVQEWFLVAACRVLPGLLGVAGG